jgi:hypothetical protein
MARSTAASGSERQGKYRRARQLSAVFLSRDTREAINALQARTGLKKEAVVALAIRNLTNDLDRKVRRSISSPSTDEASNIAGGGAHAGALSATYSSTNDAARAAAFGDDLAARSRRPSKSDTGQAAAVSGDSATGSSSRIRSAGAERKGEAQPDIFDLFSDLLPRR